MSDFVKKASSKIDKLSDEQIRRVLTAQDKKLDLRDDILDSVDTGFMVINNSLRILYINKYLSDLLQFNYNSFNTYKTSLIDVLADLGTVNAISEYVNKNKESFEHTFSHTHSILGEIKIHIRAFRTKSQIILEFRDITLLDKFRKEFQQNESLASMTTLAAGIAHEIKNPLASMSIYLQLLRKKLDKDGKITKEDADKSLNIISSEIERLNSMAVDFLFAVKPMSVDLQITNINDVVEKACSLIRAEVEDSKIKFTVHLGSSIPKIALDEHLFEECILNLVRNSIQAIEKKKQGLIEIDTYLDGNYVKLSVSDNGCGMTDSELTRIFEPYYTTKASGTGLGLTTIFKIIRQHAGEIEVSSHPGEGSVFTLKLPVPQSERFKIK